MRLDCLYRNDLDEKTIAADDVQIVKRRSKLSSDDMRIGR